MEYPLSLTCHYLQSHNNGNEFNFISEDSHLNSLDQYHNHLLVEVKETAPVISSLNLQEAEQVVAFCTYLLQLLNQNLLLPLHWMHLQVEVVLEYVICNNYL